MKKILIALAAIATFGAFGAFAPEAQAAGYSGYSSNANTGNYCAPRLLRTCEVNRCRVKKMGYDECGRCYTYYVTTVTYRDYFSDGAFLTYTKTFRA